MIEQNIILVIDTVTTIMGDGIIKKLSGQGPEIINTKDFPENE